MEEPVGLEVMETVGAAPESPFGEDEAAWFAGALLPPLPLPPAAGPAGLGAGTGEGEGDPESVVEAGAAPPFKYDGAGTAVLGSTS